VAREKNILLDFEKTKMLKVSRQSRALIQPDLSEYCATEPDFLLIVLRQA
jgi:hypothetical protein